MLRLLLSRNVRCFLSGTHLGNTREAEAFALVSEEAVAKGVRRVIAVTKDEAAAAIKNGTDLQARMAAAAQLKGPELEKVGRADWSSFPLQSLGKHPVFEAGVSVQPGYLFDVSRRTACKSS